MAQNKKFRAGPITLSNTLTTNILNPPTASGGTNAGSSSQYILVNKCRVVNRTGGAVTFSLYLGATGANAAGTEIAVGKSVPANDAIEINCNGMRIDAADFLVGGASAANSLTIEIEGEIGVAG